MTTTPSTTRIDAIRHQMAQCIAEARAQGYAGSDAEYEHTDADMTFVLAAIGPVTREEWESAGFWHMNGTYCADAG